MKTTLRGLIFPGWCPHLPTAPHHHGSLHLILGLQRKTMSPPSTLQAEIWLLLECQVGVSPHKHS